MSTDHGTQTNKRDTVSPPSTSRPSEAKPGEESDKGSAVTVEDDLVVEVKNFDQPSEEPVFSCEFEVFGIVQGVSFRMYTLRRAQKLGVRGWCQNTETNTVKGEIEAHYSPFEEMRLWLKYTGSPTSRIDKVVFTETIERTHFNFKKFSILLD